MGLLKRVDWGFFDIVKLLYDETDPKLLILGFGSACCYDHKDIVEFLLKKNNFFGDKSSFFNEGLRGACRSNCQVMIDFLFKKGAMNWCSGLVGACEGGHLELSKKIIELSKKNLQCNEILLKSGLCAACLNNRIDCVNILLEEIKKKYLFGQECMDDGFFYSCIGGHIDLIDIMMGDDIESLKDGFRGACINGNINIIQKIKKELKSKLYDVTDDQEFIRTCCFQALVQGHKDVIQYLFCISKYEIKNCLSLELAIQRADIELVRFLVEENIFIDMDKAKNLSKKHQLFNIYKYLEKITNNTGKDKKTHSKQ